MSVNKAQAEMRLILMMSLVMGMVGRRDGGKMGWWEGRNKQTYHLREQKQQWEYKVQAEMTIKG